MVSGDIKLMPIFVGVRCCGRPGLSNESADVENAILFLRSLCLPHYVSHWLYVSKFTRLRAVSLR